MINLLSGVLLSHPRGAVQVLPRSRSPYGLGLRCVMASRRGRERHARRIGERINDAKSGKRQLAREAYHKLQCYSIT